MDNRSLLLIARSEWKYLLAGSIASVALACLTLFGWPNFLPISIHQPYLYAGDGLAIDWLAQRATEGWIFDNPRSGFPFGSNFLDYPGSDTGNFLILKALGILTGSAIPAVNIYFLLSFPTTFLATFVVFRYFNIRRSFSISLALLFTFAPFHFTRFFYGHLLYMWYFSVPLFYYYGHKISTGVKLFDLRRPAGVASLLFAIAILSSFGVYFAFFGALILVVCAIQGSIRETSVKPLIAGALFSFAIFTGVAANLAPNIIDRIVSAPNPEVAQRLAIETEIFSLKTMHLLLPQPEHRISALGTSTANYQALFPLSNTTSYLGIMGILGLLAVLFSIVKSLAGRTIDPRAGFAAVIVLAIILIASPGGFSVIFSMLVTPAIRGWDRMAIFVNFGCLLALAVVLSENKKCKQLIDSARHAPLALASIILVIGILDQTPASYRAKIDGAFAVYQVDSTFIKQIESTLPVASAVYQLPYIGFPESPPKHMLSVYTPGSGFINSEKLRWSFGGMKGREGDLYYRELEKKTASEQLEAVKKMGFAAIYIDTRGYVDGASSLIKDFTALLGAPALVRADGAVVLFRIPANAQ